MLKPLVDHPATVGINCVLGMGQETSQMQLNSTYEINRKAVACLEH